METISSNNNPLGLTRLTGIVSLMLAFSIVSTRMHAQGLPRPDHILILIEENEPQPYDVVIGNSVAPTINELAHDTFSAEFTQMYAIEHPSQPNYFDLFSGSDQGVTSDDAPTDYPFTTPNLAYELLSKGLSFITYSEDLPYVGSQDTVSSAQNTSYARKHNPVADWQGTGTNQVPDSLSQPFTNFPTDFSQLPTVCYVVPDEDSDMHNGIGNPPIASGDLWFCEHLQCNSVSDYIQWANANNSLFILTFDEDDGLFANNIPTIFSGPMVKGGSYSTKYSLYNILRTIEDMYGLDHAGAAADNIPITNVWKESTTGINAATQSGSGLRIYPVPTSSVVNFDGSSLKSANAEISITDVTGRFMGKFPLSQSEKLSVNTSEYSPGVYFYRLTDGDATIESGKFMVTR